MNGRAARLFVATLALSAACTDPTAPSDSTSTDSGDPVDSSGAPDGSDAEVPEADGNGAFACEGEFATCVAPCAFDFRFVDTDRDGVAEARVASHLVSGHVVSITAVDLPEWARFSDGFAQYLDRVTGESWSLSVDGRTVAAGAPIEIPAGESFAIELRVDDPTVESCASGACGAVEVVVADCADNRATLTIPLIR